MSTIRRSRIKASASHLASLAGKRRANQEATKLVKDEIQDTKNSKKAEEPPSQKELASDNVVDKDNVSTTSLVSTVSEETPKEVITCDEVTNKAVEKLDNVPSVATAVASPRPLLKSRFRPNLSESDQQRGRLRRISGCEASPGTPVGRIRTISGSSDDFNVSGLSHQQRRPASVAQRVTESETEPAKDILRLRQVSENHDVFSPPPSTPTRTRRLTESHDKPNFNSTVFDQRKADHKKKWENGIPERTKITMFDLIYYNPSDGNRMSNSSSLRSSRAPSVDGRRDSVSEDAVVPNRLDVDAVVKRLEEENVDDPEHNQGTSEDNEETNPVPQVKVAPDGSIIIDEASTLIETTAAKKAKEDLLKSPLVFESANNPTNYGSWGKKKKNADWSDKDTIKFYKALSVFGTDFTLMEGVFKKRSRHELKMKFKKEERANLGLVNKCLSQGQTFDPTIFDSDESDEENAEERKKKEKENRRKKKQEEAQKKPRRHRIRGRRYYNDSDHDADESELASESEVIMPDFEAFTVPTEKNKIMPNRSKRNSKVLSEPSLSETTEEQPLAKKQKDDTSLLKTILSQGSGGRTQVSFPPALLAANPGLANASPGSLVVVASPASPQVASPNAQLLQVFMVGDEQDNNEKPCMPKRTRTISENRLDTTSVGRVRTHSGTTS